MANVIHTVIRNTILCPLKYATKPCRFSATIISQVRTLYSLTTLGVDGYVQQRERTQSQLANISDKFRQKMNDYTSDESKNMIFTEDLKNMVHIANSDEVDLVIKMMKRFSEQSQSMRFGNFIFGPVIMRMFHHLKKPAEALHCFNAPELTGFFDQLISYQLLMDLLYENGQYQDILDTFDNIQKRQIERTKFPRNIVVLTYAACYKLNTAESLKLALNVWTELMNVGHLPMRRAVTFCAGLALKQGQPDTALEIISSANNQNYTTIRNLKVVALCDIGRLDDVIPILKSVLNQEAVMKHTFNKDVMEKVRAVVEKSGTTENKQEFKRLEELFNEHGHISDMTLDAQLCLEIVTPPFMGNKAGQRNQPRYNRFQRNENDSNEYDGGNRYNRFQRNDSNEYDGANRYNNRDNRDNRYHRNDDFRRTNNNDRNDYQNRRPGLTDLQ